MSLLGRPLALHDVDDAERLCSHVANRAGLSLRPHQWDELITYLIGECWRLSLRYEPGKGSTTTFSGWATTNLRFRLNDWLRSPQGGGWGQQYRNGNTRPELLSLDGGLDRTLPSGHGNPEIDSSPDLGGVLAAGDRSRARDYRALG